MKKLAVIALIAFAFASTGAFAGEGERCADPAPPNDHCFPPDLEVGVTAHVRIIGGVKACITIRGFDDEKDPLCRTVSTSEILTVLEISGDYDLVRSRSMQGSAFDTVYVIYTDLVEGLPLPSPAASVAQDTRPANSDAATTDTDQVFMVEANGVYTIPGFINGIGPLQFILDSGAADVSITSDVFLTLMRVGSVNDGDYIGTSKYRLADGATVQSDQFFIHELRIGSRVLKHVAASVSNNVKSPLLLGQTFLKRLTSVAIDNGEHTLVLGPERTSTSSGELDVFRRRAAGFPSHRTTESTARRRRRLDCAGSKANDASASCGYCEPAST